PSWAARTASSSGEKAPSFSEKYGLTSRCTKAFIAPPGIQCPDAEAVRLGAMGRPHAALPRRGVGRPLARRAAPVRDARPGGSAGGPVVVHDPAQARRLPQ